MFNVAGFGDFRCLAEGDNPDCCPDASAHLYAEPFKDIIYPDVVGDEAEVFFSGRVADFIEGALRLGGDESFCGCGACLFEFG